MTAATGVLLLSFGSAVTSTEVPAYLRSVRGGREPSEELVAEFVRRFDAIGRSPLLDITRRQVDALQALLDARHGPGTHLVAMGMLHSAPRVADALGLLAAAGIAETRAIVLAPQYSPVILGGYERALATAAPQVAPGMVVTVARAWHLVPHWLDSLADRVEQALTHLGRDVVVVFTTHSLPRPVVERDPGYMEQIHATVDALVKRLQLPREGWRFAFQSAGHSPQEWLTPDLSEVVRDLRQTGVRNLLVAPVQFVADHLETLYDIDVAAAAQAETAGMALHRIAMPNDSPALVEALASVVEREGRGASAAVTPQTAYPIPRRHQDAR